MSKLSIRWIYEACYEIILPTGEHIITDPDITIHKFPEFTAEQFERADYILCTHTHFDHTSDIGYLSEKFNPKLLIGELSIMSLARFFNLSFADLYPVSNGETYDFGNVKFEFYRAKHTRLLDPVRGRPQSTLGTTIRNFGIEGHGECDQFGWVESYHILMTFSNNIRLLMASGCASNQEIYRIGKEFSPNILIRQPAFDSPAEYAAECAKFGASIVLPHHHEKLTNRWKMTWEEIEREVRTELDKRLCGCSFCLPEPYRWYEIDLGIQLKQ